MHHQLPATLLSPVCLTLPGSSGLLSTAREKARSAVLVRTGRASRIIRQSHLVLS